MTDSASTETAPDEMVALPDDLVAICLDTNAMSRGRLDIDVLEDLADVISSQQLDIQIWVPEPVLWEWAEHLSAELEKARQAFESAREQAKAAGAADLIAGPWSKKVTADDVVPELEAAVDEIEGVTLLALSSFPHAAVEGLRDQVLLRAAGRRKGQVKTGAADGAAFRLAEREHSRLGGTMLIVSGDQDATRYFADKPNILLVNNLSRAKRGIVRMRTGSEIAAGLIREAIRSRLPELTHVELGSPEVGGRALMDRSRDRGRVVQTAARLVSVDQVIDVNDVEVSRSDGYGAAVVDAFISIERDLQILNDVTGTIEMEVETFHGIRAVIDVSAESDNGTDWDITVDAVGLT